MRVNIRFISAVLAMAIIAAALLFGLHPNEQAETYPQGQVIPKVISLSDNGQNYALYLPTSYSTKRKFPVIFFFDPFAEGYHPLELYRELAERYGYILIASNYSQNGLTMPQHLKSVDALLSEVPRYSIDLERIYTSGFSGGALVANAAAILHKEVKGVIGCGGGFPPLDKPNENRFDVISIAGDEDLNFTGLMLLHEELATTGVRQSLVRFEAQHIWPPKEVMENAFIFFEMNAMRTGQRRKDFSIRDTFMKLTQNEIDKAVKAGDLRTELILYKRLIDFMVDVFDVSAVRQKFEKLASSDACKNSFARYAGIQHREHMTITTIAGGLGTDKDLQWWKGEIGELKKHVYDVEEKHMHNRVLAWSILVVKTSYWEAMQQQDLNRAEKLISILQILDPEYPELPYLIAGLKARQGK